MFASELKNPGEYCQSEYINKLAQIADMLTSSAWLTNPYGFYNNEKLEG
jgi:hypothetical protein